MYICRGAEGPESGPARVQPGGRVAGLALLHRPGPPPSCHHLEHHWAAGEPAGGAGEPAGAAGEPAGAARGH